MKGVSEERGERREERGPHERMLPDGEARFLHAAGSAGTTSSISPGGCGSRRSSRYATT